MTVSLSPFAGAGAQFFSSTGIPLAGGLIYSYQAGTSTPQTTYTTSAGTIANSNPIVLDSSGRVPYEIWLTSTASYKFVLKDYLGVVIGTYDDLSGMATAADLTTFKNNLAASSGSSLVGFIAAGGGATATTVQSKLRQIVSVLDFGADPTGVLDSTSAITAARNYIAASPYDKLVFPAGIYKYSVSPNWAINNAEIVGEGDCRLRYTGTGDAVIIDSGGSGLTYNMTMTGFIVEAPSTAQNGVYIRSVHHSRFGFNVRGAGTTYAGLKVAFAVCSIFDKYTCSVNENGWYSGAKPAYGMNLQVRNPGETVSYCTFNTPILEGLPIGIQLNGTIGNLFLGGTSEGCSQYGVFASANANNDKFVGTDFEVNTTADVYSLGLGLTLLDCESDTNVAFGITAKKNSIIGGDYQNILFDTGSQGCTAIGCVFNRFATGGTFTDQGTRSVLTSVVNGGTNTAYLVATDSFTPGTVSALGMSYTTVTVSGAKLGDIATASFSLDLSGFILGAVVTAANTVKVYALNVTAGSLTVGAGTVKVAINRC